MNLVVVSDTSPINYLLATGYIELLPNLHGQVILPSAVYGELSVRGSSDTVRQWASAFRPGFRFKRLLLLLNCQAAYIEERWMRLLWRRNCTPD